MKQIIKLSIITLIGVFLFTGCGTKFNAIGKIQGKNETRIAAYSSFHAFTKAGIYNNSMHAVMQQAAEHTLASDKKFFAIVSPAPLSNTNGVLINNMDEMVNKCNVGILTLPFTGSPCRIHNPGNQGAWAWIRIAMFDKEQNDFLVYNANNIISYLKKENQFDTDLPKSQYRTLIR